MTNKYLEKVASMFESSDYKKGLSEEKKHDYQAHYNYAPARSGSHMLRTAGGAAVAGAGGLAGFAAGAHVGGRLLGNLGTVAGGVAGGIAGALPGAKMVDKVRHGYAKARMEKKD